jgi:hypothetical protein
MTDLSNDVNHAIRSTASNTASIASAAINGAFLLLDQKPSLKIEINQIKEEAEEEPQQKSNFVMDVSTAQTMAEEGKSPGEIESYLESHSASFDQSTNKEAYMTSVLARADQLTVKKKAEEQGIQPSVEIAKSAEKAPEISL